jgi:hypothetical protein
MYSKCAINTITVYLCITINNINIITVYIFDIFDIIHYKCNTDLNTHEFTYP